MMLVGEGRPVCRRLERSFWDIPAVIRAAPDESTRGCHAATAAGGEVYPVDRPWTATGEPGPDLS
jgi:hypothetical protein